MVKSGGSAEVSTVGSGNMVSGTTVWLRSGPIRPAGGEWKWHGGASSETGSAVGEPGSEIPAMMMSSGSDVITSGTSGVALCFGGKTLS